MSIHLLNVLANNINQIINNISIEAALIEYNAFNITLNQFYLFQGKILIRVFCVNDSWFCKYA